MAKPVKSQWDFGELFELPPQPQESSSSPSPSPTRTAQSARRILTVTELTAQVRRVLEGHVGMVWVSGEITNLRVQGSGHIYFTIKDNVAQLSCVLFRGELDVDRSVLQDGRKVTLRGDVTVYEARGQYQLRVTRVELEGVGALQAAFEKLKQKLNAEGLFAQDRKRPLPRFAQSIGIVTSPSGAALRDVIHVIQRRNPALQIILAPCRVQGDGAANEIAAAIRLLNEYHRRSMESGNHKLSETKAPPSAMPLELILITRGGGSLEDLWAFNEEVVARAIFDSALPVVSAVGHEIDFTISDFVADIRAATPSAAAEIITEGVFSSCRFLADAFRRMNQLAGKLMQDKAYLMEHANHRLAQVHPRRKLNDWVQRLDDLESGMTRCVRQGARERLVQVKNLSVRLRRVRPTVLLQQRRESLKQIGKRFRELSRQNRERLRSRIELLEGRLKLLGPEQVLGRGYSITMHAETGQVIRDAGKLGPGKRLRTRLKTGEVKSRVEQD